MLCKKFREKGVGFENWWKVSEMRHHTIPFPVSLLYSALA